MKILAIGDFHGEFPKKFERIITREKIDLVISNGDYFPFHYRKLWFKHCYGQETELWEVIGKEKYKKLVLKDLKDGEKALKKLNALPIPVFTVIGNIDFTRTCDVADIEIPPNSVTLQSGISNRHFRAKGDTINGNAYIKIKKKHYWNWDEQDFFTPIIKKYKNIKRFDYSFFKFGEYVFIGAYGSSFPGRVKSKAFKKHRKILDNLFRKFRQENKEKKVIFVSHNVPFNTRLDLIGNKAHSDVKGKHYGSKLVRRIINKYQPILHFGGHIHESTGMQNIGKTLCINPGSAHEGKGAVIELDESTKGKVRVKFINTR